MNSSTKAIELESVAKILIVDNLNNALVLTIGEHRQQPERSFSPDLPGGLVEPGESEKDGAIRETLEETGIVLNTDDVNLTYAKTEYIEQKNKSISKLLYVCRLTQQPNVALSWEHSAYEWTPLDMLLETVTFRPFYHEAIKYSLIHNLV